MLPRSIHLHGFMLKQASKPEKFVEYRTAIDLAYHSVQKDSGLSLLSKGNCRLQVTTFY
jgi:hypothetical protein